MRAGVEHLCSVHCKSLGAITPLKVFFFWFTVTTTVKGIEASALGFELILKTPTSTRYRPFGGDSFQEIFSTGSFL
jgi:hypothetical protein